MSNNPKGAGRRPKYGEKTVVIPFRVPQSRAEELKALVLAFLEKCKQPLKKQ